MRDVSRAQFGRLDGNFYAPVRTRRFIVERRFFERFFKHGGNFARNAQNTLAVGSVRRYGYIEDVVVEPENGFYVLAVFAGGGEN